MVEINLLEVNIVFVGQKVYFSLHEHGSVGIKSDATSTDESIISIVTSSFDYFKPIVPGETGGDGGQRTYVFKANKEGSTTINTQEIFRGRLKEEHSIKIIVVKP